MVIIRSTPRYLLDELLADLRCGHNVRATVHMECGAMYRADGPEALRCVGETEFVNGVAAMTASGLHGVVRVAAGIVGHLGSVAILESARNALARGARTSATLAAQWNPYVETCIEAFGAKRSMFESNFPVDRFGASYVALWNAFKRLAAGCSAEEKTSLFSGTAARVYRIAV